MVAAIVGTFSFILAVIFGTPWINSLVGNWYASFGVSACIGGCLVYVCRGVDILLYEAHDNPPPFISPFDVLTTMDRLMQLFKAARRGPQYWYIKESVLDQGRLTVLLSFTEIYEGLFSHPMQLNRAIIGTITVSELPENHKGGEVEQILQGKWNVANPKPWSLVKIKWEVDSPLTRSSCSEAIDFVSKEILQVLDYPAPPEKSKLSPLVPPPWLLVALACSIYYAITTGTENQGKMEARRQLIEQRHEQRQEQLQQEQGAVQQRADQWEEQRQRIQEYKMRQRQELQNQQGIINQFQPQPAQPSPVDTTNDAPASQSPGASFDYSSEFSRRLKNSTQSEQNNGQ